MGTENKRIAQVVGSLLPMIVRLEIENDPEPPSVKINPTILLILILGCALLLAIYMLGDKSKMQDEGQEQKPVKIEVLP